jgi:acetylornithine/N-succinyldiaminopimelate aminotransferase
LLEGLRGALADMPQVTAVRGKGLILGIELAKPCTELVAQAMARGLLINVTAERVIRLLPPLILDTREADRIIETLTQVVGEFGTAAA